MLEWSKRLNVLERLGEILSGYAEGRMNSDGFDFTGRIKQKVLEASAVNSWFTEEYIIRSFKAWGSVLTTDQLQMWASRYPELPFENPKIGAE